jgi:PAS domain S-box-containing protein
MVKDKNRLLNELDEAYKHIDELEEEIKKKEQEKNLIFQSEQEKSLILDSLTEQITFYNRDLTILYVNKTAVNSLGLDADDMVGLRCMDVFKKYNFPEPKCEPCRVREAILHDMPYIGIKKASNGKVWFERVIPVTDLNGNIEKFIEVSLDITHQIKIEEELKESKQNLLNILDNTKIQMWAFNGELYSYLNKAWFQYTGQDPSLPLKIDRWTEIIHPADLDKAVEIWLKNLESKTEHENFFRLRRFDGDYRYFYSHAIPIFNSVGKFIHFQGYNVDITDLKKAEEDKKKLEEQLYHAQKMESIGRLAGGIAHDFNNILASIMGYAEWLKLKLDIETMSNESNAAEVILNATKRASELTKQLLGFARKGKYIPVPLNINNLIDEVVKVTEKMFEKKIKVIFDLQENIRTIEADRSQLNQVFTNLLINARDAMPLGGEIFLKTENICLNDEDIKHFFEMKVGNYVRLSISDTGVGIPESIKGHIFEPFFTTKGEGIGTGLGLATVYGIVKNHGGYINFQSESGKGTTFNLYFPSSDKLEIKTYRELEIIKGDATILVVDDEENIRTIAKIILDELGYRVYLAKDGFDAIKIYKNKKKQIDLVLLDLIMPNMNGESTFQKLKEINPKVKVVLSSGFSKNISSEKLLKEGALGFIQKPYLMQELSKVLNSILKK